MKIIDISPMISEELAVWPGDQSFQRKVSLDSTNGDNITLSSIQSTVHLGAHTDAPNHYHSDGTSIDQRDLSLYFGPSQVIDVSHAEPGVRLKPQDLKGKKVNAPRVLFKTLSFPNPNQWNDHFNSLSPELIKFLSDQGVRLVGIDTPSIDPMKDEVLESHNMVFKLDMAILEGIILDDVQEGNYELIAMPLKIKGADASPVRAILLSSE